MAWGSWSAPPLLITHNVCSSSYVLPFVIFVKSEMVPISNTHWMFLLIWPRVLPWPEITTRSSRLEEAANCPSPLQSATCHPPNLATVSSVTAQLEQHTRGGRVVQLVSSCSTAATIAAAALAKEVRAIIIVVVIRKRVTASLSPLPPQTSCRRSWMWQTKALACTHSFEKAFHGREIVAAMMIRVGCVQHRHTRQWHSQRCASQDTL